MSRTDCPSQDTLADFVLGKLRVADLVTVAEHLESCTECEHTVGLLDGMADDVVSDLKRMSGPVPGGAGNEPTEAAGPSPGAMPTP